MIQLSHFIFDRALFGIYYAEKKLGGKVRWNNLYGFTGVAIFINLTFLMMLLMQAYVKHHPNSVIAFMACWGIPVIYTIIQQSILKRNDFIRKTVDNFKLGKVRFTYKFDSVWYVIIVSLLPFMVFPFITLLIRTIIYPYL